MIGSGGYIRDGGAPSFRPPDSKYPVLNDTKNNIISCLSACFLLHLQENRIVPISDIMKRIQIFILWVMVLYLPVAAHDYMFKHLEVKDGLSNNQVNSIYKDSNGFMWFGTASGMNLYDGYSIKVYRSRQDDEKSLPDSYIEKIQEDAAGNLWLETGAGYAIYNSVSDDFNRDVETWMWNIGIVGRPTLIYIDKEKDFWIYVMGKGVYRYKMGDKDAEIVKIADKKFLSTEITDIIECSEGVNWTSSLFLHFG